MTPRDARMDHCPAPSSHASVLRDGIAPVLTAYARGERPGVYPRAACPPARTRDRLLDAGPRTVELPTGLVRQALDGTQEQMPGAATSTPSGCQHPVRY